MIINKNNIKYVEKNSSADNGTYTHYYYKDNIVNTTDVIYEGVRGTITTNTTVYIDTDTDLIILKDYFSWVIKYGNNTRSGVCLSAGDENEINRIINDNKVSDDGNTSLNNNLDNDKNNTYNNGNNKDNNGNNNTGDNNSNNNGSSSDGKTNNLFDDTMASSNNNPRLSLPLGANINNPEIIGIDYTKFQGPTIKETNFSNKGTTYPIIRINDHYFLDSEIVSFSMETGYYKNYFDYLTYQMPIRGFIPTMKLIINTSNLGILKLNHVKQGDKCAVFFTSNHSMVKSMRCDFRITNVVTNKMDLNRLDRYTTLIITGELYVPDLRNEEIRYNFNGSSRDAMMDAAKRLRLSFFFCDPNDTNDIMVWCNCKNMEFFIKDITTHAWKDSEAFYESWIDPRYGLSFLNINRLLGETGLDEPVDITLRINTFINNRAADGNSTEKSASEKVATDKPQSKILTNIPGDDESTTVYHVNKWRLINNAQEILDFIGLNCKMLYDSVNPGMLANGNTKYSVDFSLCLNRTKFDPDRTDNDFYVLLGPARNKTYSSGDAAMGVSETASSNVAAPEKITNLLSDGDDASITDTNGNMMSSGNTHRFYEVAYEHNMRNLLLLQKQYLDVELNGANLTLVRGEKIPIMLMDLNKADSALRTSSSRTYVEEVLFEAESGWYIIDGIQWTFDPAADTGTGTSWRTNVKLVRREWPIPGKDKQVNGERNKYSKQPVMVNIGNGKYTRLAYADALSLYGKNAILGSTTEEDVVVIGDASKSKKNNTNQTDNQTSESTTGTIHDENGSLTVSSVNFNLDKVNLYITNEDKVESSSIPLTGLKPFMKEIYKAIETASNNKVKLVSARRWAVDLYGNKIDGNAFIKKYDYYKCMNAIGEVMYFRKNNSRHLYGEAIDIINKDINFTDLMTKVIMKDPSILLLFYNNGVSAYIELAKDDTGVTTKHYHIGTDTTKQKEFWASVKAILGTDKIPGTLISFSNYMRNNNKQDVEITYNEIDENNIEKNKG